MSDSFGARDTLEVSGNEYEIYRLGALQPKFDVARLPYSIKVLLENALRLEDGESVTSENVESIATWDAKAEPSAEIPFQPARVLMQDFTGVPALVDLAAMRDAMEELGGDPERIDPLVPVDLIIDHSVQVDAFGNARAFDINAYRDYERNGERYAFLRWGQQAFHSLRVVPPATGICHQVNLEYLGQVVFVERREGAERIAGGSRPQGGEGGRTSGEDGAMSRAYPDTLVGTDSHTTMINGLGVLGWGVGGIEAEAAMLGQPMFLPWPVVVGVRMSGALPPGTTATDLVLTLTQMLRSHGVVGKFVEFYGEGLSSLTVEDRATMSNMCPEYGATASFFPVDHQTLTYLTNTGRGDVVDLVERYTKEQSLFRTDADPDPVFSESLELDLSAIEPSMAGPRRPQDRVPLARVWDSFRDAFPEFGKGYGNGSDAAVAATFPASDPIAEQDPLSGDPAQLHPAPAGGGGDPPPVERSSDDTVDHGSVVIAAITSCTNTSNPSVMLAAGLLAKKAVDSGMQSKPWVKKSLAPGSH